MAELVDALDSKSSSGNRVWVRFPLRVLDRKDKSLSNDEKLCKSTIYTAFFVSTRDSFMPKIANKRQFLVTIWLQEKFNKFSVTIPS